MILYCYDEITIILIDMYFQELFSNIVSNSLLNYCLQSHPDLSMLGSYRALTSEVIVLGCLLVAVIL